MDGKILADLGVAWLFRILPLKPLGSTALENT